jgi:hypothetical protein
VQGAQGSFDLVEVPASNEHDLQEIVKLHPQLIPADDLGLDGDLLVVGRETRLASGAIDLLCLARSGDLVLVEFKTGPQNPDFRAALAQLIDYGSDLWGTPVADFDHGVVQRYLSGIHVAESFKDCRNLREAVSLMTNWMLDKDDWDLLNTRLSDVLTNGDFRFVVAAQRFTPTMVASLDYLNATSRYGRYHLVQVLMLEGNLLTAYSAQVVAGPSNAIAAPERQVSSGQANEADFLANITDDAYREAMKDIFSTATALGLVVYWGLKGASLRIKTPDRNEPLSIAWTFLEGDGFMGARHVTLGVAPSPLKHTPSVAPAVEAFIQRIKAIPGAKPVMAKLDAYMFEPAVVPGAKVAIIAALEELVASVHALGDYQL